MKGYPYDLNELVAEAIETKRADMLDYFLELGYTWTPEDSTKVLQSQSTSLTSWLERKNFSAENPTGTKFN